MQLGYYWYFQLFKMSYPVGFNSVSHGCIHAIISCNNSLCPVLEAPGKLLLCLLSWRLCALLDSPNDLGGGNISVSLPHAPSEINT